MLYVKVILPILSSKTYTYAVPKELENSVGIGKRVVVQVRNRIYSGVIDQISSQKPDFEVKEILDVLDSEPIIGQKHLEIWKWVADYYMCSLGEVLIAALPPSMRLESKQMIYLNQIDLRGVLLDNIETKIVKTLKQRTSSLDELRKKIDVKDLIKYVNSLVDKGIVRLERDLTQKYKPKTEKFVGLAQELKSAEAIEAVMKQLSRSPKQNQMLFELIAMLKGNYNAVVSKQNLLAKVDSISAYKALVSKGYLTEQERIVDRLGTELAEIKGKNALTQSQQKALEEILELFSTKRVVLLHGVTGSGKTEVYIHLITKILSNNQQVLYLLPEIALTSQILSRLRFVFGDNVGLYHSKLSANERYEVWQKVLKGQYKIIVGVRSAVFLPFSSLGLIIVDEEHENTYKQFEPAPRYNARDVAIMLSQKINAKVLLGTATPSMETYFNAQTGKYGLVELTERYEGIEMPQIEILDMRQARSEKRLHGPYHEKLLKEIKNALDRGKQVILFRNRRGFAPYLECQACGWIPKCKYCDVSLTYHKETNKLVCHYCGYSVDIPRKCPNCGSYKLRFKSYGTERIEEDLEIFFPNANIARLDLDTTRGKHAHEKIIKAFQKGEINILVGTQMVTKGLDFENVYLVGIVDADSLLNFPDFRAHERSFQLMVQVSGRAGRKHDRGLVIIQTKEPAHPIFEFVKNNDYKGFYLWQLEQREKFNYPPFVRLIKIIVKHKQLKLVEDFSDILAIKLRQKLGNRVLGPEYPIVRRVKNWYKKEIVIKIEKKLSLTKVKAFIRNCVEDTKRSKGIYSSVYVLFDVDPM